MTKGIFAFIVLITFSGCKGKIEQAIELSHEGKYKEAAEVFNNIPTNDPKTREAFAWRQLFILRSSPQNASVQSYIDCIIALKDVQPIEESSKHYKILRRELLRKLNEKSCKSEDFLLVLDKANLIGYPENVIAAIKKKLGENISTYVKQITYKEGYREAFPILEELLKSCLPAIGSNKSIKGVLDTMLITWGTGDWYKRNDNIRGINGLSVIRIWNNKEFLLQDRGSAFSQPVSQDIFGIWHIEYDKVGLPYFVGNATHAQGIETIVAEQYRFYVHFNNLLFEGDYIIDEPKKLSGQFSRTISDQDWFNRQLMSFDFSVH